MMTREEALELLKKYNKDEFHIQHGETVGKTMRYFAENLGYADEADYWEVVGILHDIDFELWPEEHCKKAPELLKAAGVEDDIIHAVCSHGYGLCAALMRPSKSCSDMELKSLKKKFKDKRFAAGCSREVIQQGAEMLGWDLDKLLDETLNAMKSFAE